MDYKEILSVASRQIESLSGHTLDVLSINKPSDIEYAMFLGKVVSKVSPLIGNMIEFYSKNKLNELDWEGHGKWERQDPGFPDTIFNGDVEPKPGIEIKTWFPFATEITARFKDSIAHFEHDQTNVAIIAWIPESLIYGKPKVIGVFVCSGLSLAIARDTHYHKPPYYLVFEPEDTSDRTSNLQQTNTNGYVFQGDKALLLKATEEMREWGEEWFSFNPSREFSNKDKISRYQELIKTLLGKYPYRLDTNFAKMDRIAHDGLENFKTRVQSMDVDGHTVKEWARKIVTDEASVRELLGLG